MCCTFFSLVIGTNDLKFYSDHPKTECLNVLFRKINLISDQIFISKYYFQDQPHITATYVSSDTNSNNKCIVFKTSICLSVYFSGKSNINLSKNMKMINCQNFRINEGRAKFRHIDYPKINKSWAMLHLWAEKYAYVSFS